MTAFITKIAFRGIPVSASGAGSEQWATTFSAEFCFPPVVGVTSDAIHFQITPLFFQGDILPGITGKKGAFPG